MVYTIAPLRIHFAFADLHVTVRSSELRRLRQRPLGDLAHTSPLFLGAWQYGFRWLHMATWHGEVGMLVDVRRGQTHAVAIGRARARAERGCAGLPPRMEDPSYV